LEFSRINRIAESDISLFFGKVGIEPFSEDDTRESSMNVDYFFNDTLIELKIVEEEGLEKEQRQQKVAELFTPYNLPFSDVCVMDVSKLSLDDYNRYNNLMRTPIKTHVKKAGKQLKISRERRNSANTSVLFIINDGYGALSHQEFLKIARNCVSNDTSSIDFLVCAGMYFQSDKFESTVSCPLDILPISGITSFDGEVQIRKAWGGLTIEFMNRLMRAKPHEKSSKLPLLDIEFTVGEVTYIKPAPSFSEKSGFWPNGERPRKNSTGVNTCPPIAIVFPELSDDCWTLAKQLGYGDQYLKGCYEDWLEFSALQDELMSELIKPLVAVKITREHVSLNSGFEELVQFANQLFELQVKKIILASKHIDGISAEQSNYVLVESHEIGRDKKNDFCQIFLIKTIEGKRHKRILVEYARTFNEHAIAIAAAYSIKYRVDKVLYTINREYSWI
jgi:hypothetical protein